MLIVPPKDPLHPLGTWHNEATQGRWLYCRVENPASTSAEAFFSERLRPLSQKFRPVCDQVQLTYFQMPIDESSLRSANRWVLFNAIPCRACGESTIAWREQLSETLQRWKSERTIGPYYQFGLFDIAPHEPLYGGPEGVRLYERLETLSSATIAELGRHAGPILDMPDRAVRCARMTLDILKASCGSIGADAVAGLLFEWSRTLLTEVMEGLGETPDFIQLEESAKLYADRLAIALSPVGGDEIDAAEATFEAFRRDLRPWTAELETLREEILRHCSWVEYVGRRLTHVNFRRFYFDALAQANLVRAIGHLIQDGRAGWSR